MAIINDVFFGFLIGIANIIPGVSGGTFALILGIYERLINILNCLHPRLLKEALGTLKHQPDSTFLQRFDHFMKKNDFYFAARIGIGALAAIVALSSLMTFLLLNHYEKTYGFFFGLILFSIPVPLKLIKKFRWPLIGSFIAGLVLTVMISGSVNPADKAKQKSEVLKAKYELNLTKGEIASTSGQIKEFRYTTGECLFIAFSGALAISAMILPGISGSLLLILLGQYFILTRAIGDLKSYFRLDDLIFICSFTVGMILGMALFARVIKFIFSRWHDSTCSFLTGLVTGSLFVLWPFKETEPLTLYKKIGGEIKEVADQVIHTNINVMPDNLQQLIMPGAACFAGCLIMMFFLKHNTEKA